MSDTSGLSYWDAAGIALENPFSSISGATASLFNDGIFGLGGYVSPGHKDDLIKQEAQAIVQASGGSITDSQAVAQAASDVSNVLVNAGADPSLAPAWLQNFGEYLNWGILIAVLFLLYKLLSVFK